MSSDPRIGFFGKLPAHGDFVDRGLPRTFIDAWDQWLQGALANSRELLGSDWLARYMVAPIWRFALSEGLCGPSAWRGVLMPSVDRVNRYFPLTIAMPEAVPTSPLAALTHGEAWFSACEDAALAALDPNVDADTLYRHLSALGTGPGRGAGVSCPSFGSEGASAWHFGLPTKGVPDLQCVVAEALLHQGYPHCSLWWSTGSESIPPGLLIHRGLPSIHDFAALLDGQWQRWGWAHCDVSALSDATPAQGARGP